MKRINNHAIYLFAFFIFFFDFIAPLGIASGTLYGLVVCLTLWTKLNDDKYTYNITALSIVLTILGYYISPSLVAPNYVVITNRGLAIVIIIVSAVFVIHQKKLDKRIKDLCVLSTTDPLTHTGNRLAFNVDVKSEISRHDRYERQLTIALLDVDNLKFINDNYGHFEGDRALCLITDFINNNIRDSDRFYRIGGDEFAILYIETSLRESVVISNVLREGIESISNCSNYPLTISLGLAVFIKNESQEKWLSRADAELYKAKESGKNKVSF